MGRLQAANSYLIGSIDNCPNGGEVWRDYVTPFLENLGVRVFNPTKKPSHLTEGREDKEIRENIQQYKNLGHFDIVTKLAQPIRRIDLRLVDLSHFLIMNLDHNILSCGTHEEWVTANRQKKPIIVRCEQGKAAIPNWMFAAMPHEMFFGEWREVFDYLRFVDETENMGQIHPRWVFI